MSFRSYYNPNSRVAIFAPVKNFTNPVRPIWLGSIFILSSLIASFVSLNPQQEPSMIARNCSILVGTGLILSIFADLRKGWRNLFRVDLLCLTSLYGLTFLEFLFPQQNFNQTTTANQTVLAVNAVLVGFTGLTLGRHLAPKTPMRAQWLQFKEISNSHLFYLFFGSAFLGFLWMLLNVDFNLLHLVQSMMGARFTQPWARGRYGGSSVFLSELQLFLLVVPALFGIIWNRRKTFNSVQFYVSILIIGLTLFQGFTGGTRFRFVLYMASLLAGYIFSLTKNTLRNTVIPIGIVGVILYIGVYHMLQFRNIGFAAYLAGHPTGGFMEDTFFVDYNLRSLGQVIEAFLAKKQYLGLEVFWWVLVRPIPRILFPGKPEGLTISIESVTGASASTTIATTYVGESFMAGGLLMVFVVSLSIGLLSAWWNRLSAQRDSAYSMLVYASGFAVAALTMRSMFETTTLMLPVLALILYPRLIARSLRG